LTPDPDLDEGRLQRPVEPSHATPVEIPGLRPARGACHLHSQVDESAARRLDQRQPAQAGLILDDQA
jgi:hypothetical protein